jgi:hypothetical protein
MQWLGKRDRFPQVYLNAKTILNCFAILDTSDGVMMLEPKEVASEKHSRISAPVTSNFQIHIS